MGWMGVITNAGRSLMARAAGGEGTLIIKSATIGSGTRVSEAAMRAATNLANEKAAGSIVSSRASEAEGTVTVNVSIGPAQSTAYVAREIGLWAGIGNETPVLFALHQDETGINIPTAGDYPSFAATMSLIQIMDNAAEVNIDWGVYVTAQQMEERIADKMNKSDIRRLAVEIGPEDWTENTSGKYEYALTNSSVTANTAVYLMGLDETGLNTRVTCTPGAGVLNFLANDQPAVTVACTAILMESVEIS